MGVWLRRVGRGKASQVPCRSKTPTTPSAPQPGRRLAAGRLRMAALFGQPTLHPVNYQVQFRMSSNLGSECTTPVNQIGVSGRERESFERRRVVSCGFDSDPDRSGSQTESGAHPAAPRNFAPNLAQTRSPGGSLRRGVVLTTEPLVARGSSNWLPECASLRTILCRARSSFGPSAWFARGRRPLPTARTSPKSPKQPTLLGTCPTCPRRRKPLKAHGMRWAS